MSINMACLCKQSVDICPKKASKHLYTCDKQGGLCSVVRCESTFFSPPSLPGQYVATLGHLFARALFVLFKPRIGNMSAGFYMKRGRFFGVLQSSFCFSQILCYEADKSQILVRNSQESRVHNLHSLYSSNRNIPTLNSRGFVESVFNVIKVFTKAH